MGGPGLVERVGCPGCRAPAESTAIVYPVGKLLPYDDPRLVAYLTRFYEGRADLSRLERGRYELRRCRRCRLWFQAQVPDDALLADLYDRWIDTEATRQAKAEREPTLAGEYRALLDRLTAALGRPAAGARLLDLGMGWGGFARAAREAGFDVIGIEVSEQRRAAAEDDGITVHTPVQLQAGALDGTVDVAVAIQVFEHLVDPAGAAADVARTLKPGGLLHIEVPDGSERRLVPLLRKADWNAPKNTRWSLNPVAPLEHVNCYPPAALEAVLAGAGLEPLGPKEQKSLRPSGSARTRFLATGALAATGRRTVDESG